LNKEDVASAVIATDIFDFLITLVSNSDASDANVIQMETI
jgi:hypothetical protein